LQIGKDDDKNEKKYQKYIYYASKGYQKYGESSQDTNTKPQSARRNLTRFSHVNNMDADDVK
jgi:hypothetical protein